MLRDIAASVTQSASVLLNFVQVGLCIKWIGVFPNSRVVLFSWVVGFDPMDIRNDKIMTLEFPPHPRYRVYMQGFIYMFIWYFVL